MWQCYSTLHHTVIGMLSCLMFDVCSLPPHPTSRGHLAMIIKWKPTFGLTTCPDLHIDHALFHQEHPGGLKHKDTTTQKSGVIYRYKCDREVCDEKYTGESTRTFGERFKEHLKAPFPIFEHCNITGHHTSVDNFIIVGWESQNLTRTMREAIVIRVDGPSLNRNISKYQWPYIWDEVLLNTAGHKCE